MKKKQYVCVFIHKLVNQHSKKTIQRGEKKELSPPKSKLSTKGWMFTAYAITALFSISSLDLHPLEQELRNLNLCSFLLLLIKLPAGVTWNANLVELVFSFPDYQ